MTISEAEMPSLVTLVCAAAGKQVSTTAPAAKLNVLNDLDIDVSSPWGPYDAKGGAITPSLFIQTGLFKPPPASDTLRRSRRHSACSRSRASASWSASAPRPPE